MDCRISLKRSMSQVELLTLYIGKAGAVGVEVQFITPAELEGHLRGLLSLHGSSKDGEEFGWTGSDSHGGAAEDGTSRGLARVAALPAEGWPEGLRETVASVLADSDFEIVAPILSDKGFGWDREALDHATLGITFCDAFLADTGSLVLRSGPGMGTLASLMPEVHLALSTPEGCYESFTDYLVGAAGALPSRLSLITGPSRTGDIEMTMTTGVHGPRRVLHWILVEP